MTDMDESYREGIERLEADIEASGGLVGWLSYLVQSGELSKGEPTT